MLYQLPASLVRYAPVRHYVAVLAQRLAPLVFRFGRVLALLPAVPCASFGVYVPLIYGGQLLNELVDAARILRSLDDFGDKGKRQAASYPDEQNR